MYFNTFLGYKRNKPHFQYNPQHSLSFVLSKCDRSFLSILLSKLNTCVLSIQSQTQISFSSSNNQTVSILEETPSDDIILNHHFTLKDYPIFNKKIKKIKFEEYFTFLK